MLEKPHPLALILADLTRAANANAPRFTLLAGGGSGRNVSVLLAAGLHVDILEEDAARAATIAQRFGERPSIRIAHGSYAAPDVFKQRYDAVLSTHALLHGSPLAISSAIHALNELLAPGADMLFTLGSKRDARFGTGERIGEQTWAPSSGPETGVPHVYYDREEAQALLRSTTVVSLREVPARDIVGRWAHERERTPEIVHWFAHVKKS
jgi:hypothetical protein